MAKCDLCGQDAGLLRKRHKGCEIRYEAGKAELITLVTTAALTSANLQSVRSQLAQIAEQSYIKADEEKTILIEGWQQAVERALEDGVLSAEEERSLAEFAGAFSLSQDDLDTTGAYTRVGKAAVIREVLEGKLPQRMTVVGDLPFNFQKGETLIWVFSGVTYYEQRMRTHYTGSYQGVSMRVANGLYYRVGGFKGHPVSTSTAVNLGQGLLGITDKNIYFGGGPKAFRVKYDKIVSITPYSDGIEIQRDAQTAKPQLFVTGDGWFTYNLVANLAKRTAA